MPVARGGGAGHVLGSLQDQHLAELADEVPVPLEGFDRPGQSR